MLNCTIGSDNVVNLNSATKCAWLNANIYSRAIGQKEKTIQSIYRQNVRWFVKIRDEKPKRKKRSKTNREKKNKRKTKTKSNRFEDVLHEREMIILCCAFDFAIDFMNTKEKKQQQQQQPQARKIIICKSSPIRNIVALWTQITI